MIARLRPEARQKYLGLHRNPDPHIVEALRRRHHRNYALYLGDDLLVASFSYDGEDLDRDRAELQAEPRLGEWFAKTAECQVVPQLPDTIWTTLDRIFHCE
jgi:L-rhamnose mutarotase